MQGSRMEHIPMVGWDRAPAKRGRENGAANRRKERLNDLKKLQLQPQVGDTVHIKTSKRTVLKNRIIEKVDLEEAYIWVENRVERFSPKQIISIQRT